MLRRANAAQEGGEIQKPYAGQPSGSVIRV
jgi:hypothetical protein